MKRYHYRIIECDGYVHENWLFADSTANAWLKLAQVAGRMETYKDLKVASLHIDRVTD